MANLVSATEHPLMSPSTPLLPPEKPSEPDDFYVKLIKKLLAQSKSITDQPFEGIGKIDRDLLNDLRNTDVSSKDTNQVPPFFSEEKISGIKKQPKSIVALAYEQANQNPADSFSKILSIFGFILSGLAWAQQRKNIKSKEVLEKGDLAIEKQKGIATHAIQLVLKKNYFHPMTHFMDYLVKNYIGIKCDDFKTVKEAIFALRRAQDLLKAHSDKTYLITDRLIQEELKRIENAALAFHNNDGTIKASLTSYLNELNPFASDCVERPELEAKLKTYPTIVKSYFAPQTPSATPAPAPASFLDKLMSYLTNTDLDEDYVFPQFSDEDDEAIGSSSSSSSSPSSSPRNDHLTPSTSPKANSNLQTSLIQNLSQDKSGNSSTVLMQNETTINLMSTGSNLDCEPMERVKITHGSGLSVEGNVKNNKLQGLGKVTLPDGKIFEGYFKDNLLNGRGKITVPIFEKEGEPLLVSVEAGFKDNEIAQGPVIIRIPNGNIIERGFEPDYDTPTSQIYLGGSIFMSVPGLANGRLTANGTITFRDGKIAEGCFVDQSRNLEGILSGRGRLIDRGVISEGVFDFTWKEGEIDKVNFIKDKIIA